MKLRMKPKEKACLPSLGHFPLARNLSIPKEVDWEENTTSNWLDLRPPAKTPTLWLDCPLQFHPAADFCHPAGLDIPGGSLHVTPYRLPAGFQASRLHGQPRSLIADQNGPDSAFACWSKPQHRIMPWKRLCPWSGAPWASPRVSSGYPRWLLVSRWPLMSSVHLRKQDDY